MEDNSIKMTFDDVLDSKITDVENQINKAWNDYQKQLSNLQKIHNDKLAELEKLKRTLDTFKDASSESISLDLLETIESKANELKLSDEEMIIILTRLAKLTSKENEKVIPQEEPKKVKAISNQNKDKKQEVNDIKKEYEKLLIEIEKVRENREQSNFDNIYEETIMNSGNLSTSEQKIAFEEFVKKGQLYKRNIDSIEDNFLYLKKSIDGVSLKSIMDNKQNIKATRERIEQLITENEELAIEFEIAFEDNLQSHNPD